MLKQARKTSDSGKTKNTPKTGEEGGSGTSVLDSGGESEDKIRPFPTERIHETSETRNSSITDLLGAGVLSKKREKRKRKKGPWV